MLPVVFGVPQGLSLQNRNEIFLFADDTNIFVKAISLKLAYEAANELLRQFSDYKVCNKLHRNLEKSCILRNTWHMPISSIVYSLIMV